MRWWKFWKRRVMLTVGWIEKERRRSGTGSVGSETKYVLEDYRQEKRREEKRKKEKRREEKRKEENRKEEKRRKEKRREKKKREERGVKRSIVMRGEESGKWLCEVQSTVSDWNNDKTCVPHMIQNRLEILLIRYTKEYNIMLYNMKLYFFQSILSLFHSRHEIIIDIEFVCETGDEDDSSSYYVIHTYGFPNETFSW